MLKIERQGSVDVMRVKGPLRSELLQDTKNAAKLLIRNGWPSIVLDLSQTLLLSGEALEWLLDFDRQCAERGGSFYLAEPSELCSESLRITGVGKSLQLYSDVSTAVGRFAT